MERLLWLLYKEELLFFGGLCLAVQVILKSQSQEIVGGVPVALLLLDVHVSNGVAEGVLLLGIVVARIKQQRVEVLFKVLLRQHGVHRSVIIARASGHAVGPHQVLLHLMVNHNRLRQFLGFRALALGVWLALSKLILGRSCSQGSDVAVLVVNYLDEQVGSLISNEVVWGVVYNSMITSSEHRRGVMLHRVRA